LTPLLCSDYNGSDLWIEKEVEALEANRRVVVRLPHRLVDAIDAVAEDSRRHRSELIRESVEFYLAELQRQKLRELLIAGYQEWNHLTLAFKEERWDLAGLRRE
jgi:CopG family transcriptional regulator/antitoxin EndoAI